VFLYGRLGLPVGSGRRCLFESYHRSPFGHARESHVIMFLFCFESSFIKPLMHSVLSMKLAIAFAIYIHPVPFFLSTSDLRTSKVAPPLLLSKHLSRHLISLSSSTFCNHPPPCSTSPLFPCPLLSTGVEFESKKTKHSQYVVTSGRDYLHLGSPLLATPAPCRTPVG
jgi:hypothetical protein